MTETINSTWEQDISEVFLRLPDTLFSKGVGMKEGLPLTVERRKALLQSKQILINTGQVSFTLSTLDSTAGFMNFFIDGFDNGIDFSIKKWTLSNGKPMYGICRRLSDMCCTFSKVWFLEPSRTGWKDVSQNVFEDIILEDFLVESLNLTKISAIDGDPAINILFQAEQQDPVASLVVDWLDLSLDRKEADWIMQNIVVFKLLLKWDGKRFTKKALLE